MPATLPRLPPFKITRAIISAKPIFAIGRPSLDIFSSFDPDAIMHLAAESHVDRSIDGPADFINTNVVGSLCPARYGALAHWRKLGASARIGFRFHHVSTDEVYGALPDEGYFTEDHAI